MVELVSGRIHTVHKTFKEDDAPPPRIWYALLWYKNLCSMVLLVIDSDHNILLGFEL
jgi:hypothetical protein